MIKNMSETYYQSVSDALKRAGVCTPTLVIDKERLDRNIDYLIDVLNQGFDYRLVTKSLPSFPLLNYIMRRTGTQRVMCFHLPFLKQLVAQAPACDVLMGKPLPIQAVRQFYDWHATQTSSMCFSPEVQLQWLIDNDKRLSQLEAFAEERNIICRVNLEIDVGLHRGGFNRSGDFICALHVIRQSRHLTLTGLMGYEAHITKIPRWLGGIKKALADSQSRYQKYVELVESEMGLDTAAQLCLNTGGSTTYTMYGGSEIVNEISAGAALVKPANFDAATLEHHQSASMIAAPVLKVTEQSRLPMTGILSSFMRSVGLLSSRSCFIYGGRWLADPCYPVGTRQCRWYGRSSNQEKYGLRGDAQIEMDDFIFLRPRQSEAVFNQFGQIAIYEEGNITEWWPVFQEQLSGVSDKRRVLPPQASLA